jgi:CHASE2 domain-containing sensor protein
MTEPSTRARKTQKPAHPISFWGWIFYGLGSLAFMVHCVAHFCADGHLAHQYWPGYGTDLFWITCWGATMMIVGWRQGPRSWLLYMAVCAAGLFSFVLPLVGVFLFLLPLAALLRINAARTTSPGVP